MATINAKKLTVTFKNIYNESQLEQVTIPAELTKCEYEVLDFSTKVVVKAKNKQQLEDFIKQYNS